MSEPQTTPPAAHATEEQLAKALEALTERVFNRCLFPLEVREAFSALDAYWKDAPDA